MLLFDEPTASLDEMEEKRVYQLLERLQAGDIAHCAASVICVTATSKLPLEHEFMPI